MDRSKEDLVLTSCNGPAKGEQSSLSTMRTRLKDLSEADIKSGKLMPM